MGGPGALGKGVRPRSSFQGLLAVNGWNRSEFLRRDFVPRAHVHLSRQLRTRAPSLAGTVLAVTVHGEAPDALCFFVGDVRVAEATSSFNPETQGPSFHPDVGKIIQGKRKWGPT